MQPETSAILDRDTEAVRRVLLVDDSRLQLKIVSAMLMRWGFEVLQAESGPEALEICRKTPPDLVLSDWMMPGMDGLEFCRRFRNMQSEQYGYFILLTSKSEKDEVAQGLDAGADDFLTKPVNAHELRARLNAGARVVSMERQLSEKNRLVSEAFAELKTIHEAIDNDLKQARKIQQALIPVRTRVIGSTRVSLFVRPCGHVGGDLVGMFTPGFDRLGLYSIDVSGHGITSAMVTARVAGYMSSTFLDQNIALEKRFDQYYAMREPRETGRLLNQRLAGDPGVEEYLTMAYIAGDMNTGRIKMVQAGHPPPILLRADGQAEFLGNGGLPIGLVDEVSYDQVDFTMQKGDRLLLYSDGFTEAVMKNGKMLEEDGLARLFRASVEGGSVGPELLDDMFWRLTAEMQDAELLGDDVSAALLEFDAVPR